MNHIPYLSVVIPSYNESANIDHANLEHVYSYLKDQTYSFEIILADDGSTDNTLSYLEKFALKKPEVIVLPFPHQGKGPTVTKGMLEAKGKNRLYTDFDQSTPIEEVEKLLPFRNRRYSVIIGSREVKGSARENEPWHRHLMGKGFNYIVKIFTIRGIQDTQCGFKLFSKKATESLFPKLKVTNQAFSDAFTGAFDVELLYLAQKYHFKIAEVPILWRHIESPRVHPIKDSYRMLFQVVRIRLADLLGRYPTPNP